MVDSHDDSKRVVFKGKNYLSFGKMILVFEACYWYPIQYVKSFYSGRNMKTGIYGIATKF